ncbi:DUF1007 family protein [Loktanella agnita]
MFRWLTLCAALMAPAQLAAHPHVFVRTKMAVVFDDSGEISVRLQWYYDEYFSLLVTADLGLDPDGDMLLTADEQALLDEQITAWPADYTGDLEVVQGATVLPLAEKRNHRMTFENGLFYEVHLRPIAEIADRNAPLTLLAYDPHYYVAYDLEGPVVIEGRDDCTVTVTPANLDAAYTTVEELLYGRPASDVGPDEEFPEVGQAFADTVTVTCAAPL